jgi:hypothetical protein
VTKEQEVLQARDATASREGRRGHRHRRGSRPAGTMQSSRWPKCLLARGRAYEPWPRQGKTMASSGVHPGLANGKSFRSTAKRPPRRNRQSTIEPAGGSVTPSRHRSPISPVTAPKADPGRRYRQHGERVVVALGADDDAGARFLQRPSTASAKPTALIAAPAAVTPAKLLHDDLGVFGPDASDADGNPRQPRARWRFCSRHHCRCRRVSHR